MGGITAHSVPTWFEDWCESESIYYTRWNAAWHGYRIGLEQAHSRLQTLWQCCVDTGESEGATRVNEAQYILRAMLDGTYKPE